jgi:hypothetical protein
LRGVCGGGLGAHAVTPALPEPVHDGRPLVLFVDLADDIGTDYTSGGVNVYLFEGAEETSTSAQPTVPLSASE